MDYYQTLNIDKTASQEDIKKAFKSLAMKHHPDRGGDQTKFKEISAAYDILSDPQKRAEYDQQQAGGGSFRFHTGGGFQDINDIFANHGAFAQHFQDIFGRPIRKNRDLNIQCQISLLDSFTGKQLEANFNLPSGKSQNVVINIPPGIEHGTTIRYHGLGDDSHPQLQRGNLNVTIIVMPDPNFRRQGDDLYTSIEINPIEAMIGCRKKVKKITGEEVEIHVRPGVNPGTEYASSGQGFANTQGHSKGRFVTVINILTPAVTDPTLVSELQKINAKINPRE